HTQGRTDNSLGPRAIGDHGAPVSLPKLKKANEKGTRGSSWGPLLTPGPRAVPEFPNGQSTPGHTKRPLWKRIKEHVKNIQKGFSKHSVSKHFLTHHNFYFIFLYYYLVFILF
ncbi:unnamed protein product, partial [Staurois parvus]